MNHNISRRELMKKIAVSGLAVGTGTFLASYQNRNAFACIGVICRYLPKIRQRVIRRYI